MTRDTDDAHLADEQLSARLNDTLSGPEAGRVDGHLRRCQRCRDEFESLRTIVRVAAEIPAEWPGKEDAWETLVDRLEERRMPGRGRRSWAWTLAGAGGVAAAALAAILIVGDPLSEPAPRTGAAVVAAMLEVDRVVQRSVAELTEREDWGTPSARRVIAQANREIDEGIEALERTLRERPGDPTRIDLLARAIEHRRGLTLEASR